MAERRTLREVLFGTAETKRSTGLDFLRENTSLRRNSSYILGQNTSAGDYNLSGLGNGASNSAVVACLQILGLSFSEATLMVTFKDDEGMKEEIPNHPFADLMRRPNPFMSGDVVQQYIINAMHVSGDAYLLKQKNNAGELVALYPLMPENVEPKGTAEQLITHYIYEMDDGKVQLDNTDVVHFKLGLNPEDHKSGFAPLKTVLREIYGDESAGQMATALLANSGVPSIMISPKDEYGLTDEEAQQITKTYQSKVSGKNRGKPLILSGSMNVEKLSFSPKDLDIGQLRTIPEERISAVLGVPAVLAGLGAGLQHATYNNTSELREFFTEQKLIPLWRMIAEELTQQVLLANYDSNQAISAEYNLTEVRALQQDETDMYNRLNIGVQGGWITVAEARKQIGLPVNDSQEVYLLPNTVMQVPANMEVPEPIAEDKPPTPEVTPDVITEDIEENVEKSYKRFEEKVIEKIGNQFCVIAEDTGKNMGCYPTLELAEARLEQISRFSENPKEMIAKDVFTTEEEAEARAQEIGCEGTHSMNQDGETVYMPCSTHDRYNELTESSYATD